MNTRRATLYSRPLGSLPFNAVEMSPLSRITLALCVAWITFGANAARADTDDRNRPVTLTFERRGETDLAKGRTEIVGNVVLSQGATLLRAERASVRETPDGFYQANATGTTEKQVSFRQNRVVPRRAVEGSADQVDYEAGPDTIRLHGRVHLRHVEGTQVTHELTGASVIFDKRADVISVEGGSQSPNPHGRGRIVWMPSAPAKDAESPETALTLQPTLTLRLGR